MPSPFGSRHLWRCPLRAMLQGIPYILRDPTAILDPAKWKAICMVTAGRPHAALLMQAPFKYQKITSRIAFRDLDAMLRLSA